MEVNAAYQDPPDAIDLSLIAAGTSERATVRLPVMRPYLELLPGRSQIQGLGLETATISVRAVGLPNPAGRLVTVTSDFASVSPMEVLLNDQGVGTTTIRSVSFGEAAINATSPPLSAAKAPIRFSWPIAFFVASILGGISGAALARIQSAGRKKKLQTVLIRGVLTGIIMVALYAIGVTFCPFVRRRPRERRLRSPSRQLEVSSVLSSRQQPRETIYSGGKNQWQIQNVLTPLATVRRRKAKNIAARTVMTQGTLTELSCNCGHRGCADEMAHEG